ncbi:hypothetical protein JD844_021155 [Phrynosoma platyrhinos]|uniref:Uncharacterized protein n=1 Tax=Phrynosoma platyrhinos TaxID=52577 RepID=A0ABQ7ST80_PHRPL|nr:hypothetical protein JD844_021155 [Phrynosoma platyrhinos]
MTLQIHNPLLDDSGDEDPSGSQGPAAPPLAQEELCIGASPPCPGPAGQRQEAAAQQQAVDEEEQGPEPSQVERRLSELERRMGDLERKVDHIVMWVDHFKASRSPPK